MARRRPLFLLGSTPLDSVETTPHLGRCFGLAVPKTFHVLAGDIWDEHVTSRRGIMAIRRHRLASKGSARCPFVSRRRSDQHCFLKFTPFTFIPAAPDKPCCVPACSFSPLLGSLLSRRPALVVCLLKCKRCVCSHSPRVSSFNSSSLLQVNRKA